MFKINKIAAIANAIVSTAQGVAMALGSAPPPINFVLAALTAAAGAAQIAAIKKTQFGGGGAVGTFPAAPATGLPFGGGDFTSGNQPADFDQEAIRSPATQVNITIEGIPTRETIIALAEELNDLIGDGFELAVTP